MKLDSAATVRAACVALLITVALIVFAPVHAQSAAATVTVTEPFIDVRTGPGSGYPVTFVIARGESIEILFRRTDWFKVRTSQGREGWVHRTQLDALLAGGGSQRTLRDFIVDTALARRVEVGAAWGQFKSDPQLLVWTGLRATEALSLVGTLGHVYGDLAGAEYWHFTLVSEPWSDRKYSPFFAIGGGQMSGVARSRTSSETVDPKLLLATVGVKIYLNQHLIVRTEYTINTAYLGSTRISDSRAPSIGLAYLF